MRALALVLLASALAACAATMGEEVQRIVNTIEREGATAKPQAKVLDGEIAKLSRILDERKIHKYARWLVHYYRGFAYYIKYQQARSRDAEADAAGRKALKDFDSALILHAMSPQLPGRPEIQAIVRNAAYLAGMTASLLGDTQKAYAYFRRCANEDHAGCLNVVAWAMVTGEGQTAVDLDDAIAMHERVYQHGTEFKCAGPFSASAIAKILHFRGGPATTATDLDWLGRARALIAKLEKERRIFGPCYSDMVLASEYLMRLSRGETRRDLLDMASENARTDERRDVIAYLKGELDESTYRGKATEAAKDRSSAACNMYFFGWWQARARGQVGRMKEYYGLLSSLDADRCRLERALAELGRAR